MTYRQMTYEDFDLEGIAVRDPQTANDIQAFASILTILHSNIVSKLKNGEVLNDSANEDRDSPNKRQLAMGKER